MRQQRLTRKEKEAQGGAPQASRYARKQEKLRAQAHALPKSEPVLPPKAGISDPAPQPKPAPPPQVMSASARELKGMGKVTRCKPHEAYGFITTPDNDRIIFSRDSEGFPNVEFGMRVTFTAIAGDKGWKALEMKAF